MKKIAVKSMISMLIITLVVISPLQAVVAMEIVPRINEIKVPVELLTAEEALTKAKELFEIPKELDTLHTNYQEDSHTSAWNFQWFSKTGQHGEVAIRVDAKTGSIVSYHQYDPAEHYDSTYQSYVPKLAWEEGLEKAQQAITKFSNKKSSEYQLISKQQYPLHKGLKHYEYQFEQIVAGIPFKNQTISVTVNADNGKVRYYNMNWLNDLATNQQSKISKEDVLNLYKDEYGIELAYVAPFNSTRDQRNQVTLVYRAVNANQFIVDATTGEVIEPNISFYNQFGSGGDMAKETMDNRIPAIEEFEQSELDSISGLLSQDQALQKAISIVDIPSQYKHTYSNMQRNWDFPQNRTWNFRWEYNEQQEDKQYHGTIEVDVDASSGKLVRLTKYQYPDENQTLIDENDVVIKSEDDAIAKVKEYISNLYPEHIHAIEVKNTEGWKMFEGQESPLTYHVRFHRVVNGIPFDQNVITANISAKTGEITFFHIVWAELEFPTPQGIIEAKDMLATFLTDNPIELQYNKYFDNKELLLKTRLVYTFANLETTLYDAKSGVALESSGEVKKQKQAPYTDIAYHWAEADIRFLERYEVLPFQTEQLKPNQPITQEEFMSILLKIERPYERVISTKAVNQFVVERRLYVDETDHEFDASRILSREDMAYLLVTFLNYQEVAKLDIYNLTFADLQQISNDRRGSVAIINGLGVMTGGTKNEFMPLKQATRAEAITTVVKLLKK